MNTARLLVPIFTLRDFLYLLLDFLLAGFRIAPAIIVADFPRCFKRAMIELPVGRSQQVLIAPSRLEVSMCDSDWQRMNSNVVFSVRLARQRFQCYTFMVQFTVRGN